MPITFEHTKTKCQAGKGSRIPYFEFCDQAKKNKVPTNSLFCDQTSENRSNYSIANNCYAVCEMKFPACVVALFILTDGN